MTKTASPVASTPRYRAETLRDFVRTLFERAGVRTDIATDVATILVDGDLLGHTTHGLALLPLYLDALTNDRMTKSGEPEVLNRRAAAETWMASVCPDRGLHCARSIARWRWQVAAARAAC